MMSSSHMHPRVCPATGIAMDSERRLVPQDVMVIATLAAVAAIWFALFLLLVAILGEEPSAFAGGLLLLPGLAWALAGTQDCTSAVGHSIRRDRFSRVGGLVLCQLLRAEPSAYRVRNCSGPQLLITRVDQEPLAAYTTDDWPERTERGSHKSDNTQRAATLHPDRVTCSFRTHSGDDAGALWLRH